jgi:RHS repeat-associated protein
LEQYINSVVTEYNTYTNGYVPDPFGRIHKETKSFDNQSFTVGYDYDVMGRMTWITYPTGQSVEYQYNNLGQLQKVPGFVDEVPEYDQGGFLKSLKAVNGITTNYDYDQNGRLTSLNYANQSSTLKAYQLRYDEASNIVRKNNDTFMYDSLNQLIYAKLYGNFEVNPDEETQKVGNTRNDFKGLKSFEFELNEMDLIELDYAAGSIGVDLLDQVKVSRVVLTPNGPVHRVKSSKQLRVYYSQDNVNYTRITDWKMVPKEKGGLELVLGTPVTARFLKVKSMFDERNEKLEPVNEAQFVNVSRDVIRVYYLLSSRQEDYTYDKNGNRDTETITQRYPVFRKYNYDNTHTQLVSNGKYNFTYDSNGNLTKKETIIGPKVVWRYEYDLFNRLTKVTKDDQVAAEYMYDESRLRIKKTSPKTSVYYVFDVGGNVLYEQENREYIEYVYILEKNFARVDGNLDNGIGKKYFYHTDHLGSTVLVTDEAGKQVWSAEYTPFGKVASHEGELEHAAKFTGKDLDEDTGLYYFNARWYDQEVGRFVSEDPGDDPNNPNLYTYCANNPLINTDPSGTESKWEKELYIGSNKDTSYNADNYTPKNTYDEILTEYTVTQDLLSKSIYTRPGTKMGEIRGIVIHYVANPQTSAKLNRDYWESLKKGIEILDENGKPTGEYYKGSAHYVVGQQGEVLQAVPENELAIQAGPTKQVEAIKKFPNNGKDNVNLHTIGIEMTHIDEAGNSNYRTYTTTVRLTADLLRKYHLTIEDLYRHYDISMKDCPRRFVNRDEAWKPAKPGSKNAAWEQFKQDVQTAMNQREKAASQKKLEFSFLGIKF